MKCPKCGEDNPEGTLFCEKCDWRMDQRCSRKMAVPALYLCLLSAAAGISSVALYSVLTYASVALGIAGMVLSGYSFTLARFSQDMQSKTPAVVAAAGGIGTSVAGFLLGLYALLG
jgi:uncharacterized membrane protein YvbJ